MNNFDLERLDFASNQGIFARRTGAYNLYVTNRVRK